MAEAPQDTGSSETPKWEWAEGGPTEVSRLIGEQAPKLGLDARKLRAGYVLHLIYNDDAVSLNAARLLVKRRPERAFGQKGEILARINWELAQEDTPRTVKGWLTKARDAIAAREWKSAEDIQEATKTWQDTALANVRVMIEANLQGAGDAYREYRSFEEEMSRRKKTEG